MAPSVLFLAFLLSISHSLVSGGHSLGKRKAPEGKMYVFSKLDGCVDVQSVAPCTVTWKLDSYVAKAYVHANKLVNTTLDFIKNLGYGKECVDALKSTFCSQAAPRCSANVSRDYGNAKEECLAIYDSCPSNYATALKQQNFCGNLEDGKHETKCVAPTKRIQGICPQPKYKMPDNFLKEYKKNSLALSQSYGQFHSTGVFSEECLTQLEELSCSPFYCSEDEKYLLTQHDQKDCNETVKKCFDALLQQLSSFVELKAVVDYMKESLRTSCNALPSSAFAQTMPVPPQIAPVSVASGQKTTAVDDTKIVSTTSTKGLPSSPSVQTKSFRSTGASRSGACGQKVNTLFLSLIVLLVKFLA